MSVDPERAQAAGEAVYGTLAQNLERLDAALARIGPVRRRLRREINAMVAAGDRLRALLPNG